ncbi:MAG: signal peptide peptidase SppA [Planctomycetota bacterium]|nr:signal peptide peptidase SppA [Planctomycetota bacterium]
MAFGCLLGFAIVLGVGLACSLFMNFALMAVTGSPAVRAGKYLETKVSGEGSDRIVLIPLNGIIMRSAGPSVFGVSRDMVEECKKKIRQAVDDPDVKVIILEIDSPGGSVTASDILHRELIRAREKGKHVMALMGNLCASGGYYVAVGAEKIYAHPTTLTGSIGVIVANLDLSELMKEFGVRENVVKSGKIKDILSSTRPMTEEERLILQKIVDELHGRFLKLVAEGRSLTREQIWPSADGRVFLAGYAKDHGLIDEIGYLEDAIEGAKKLANLSEARVVRYRREPTLAEVLLGARTAGGSQTVLTLPVRIPAAAPEVLYLYRPGR